MPACESRDNVVSASLGKPHKNYLSRPELDGLRGSSSVLHRLKMLISLTVGKVDAGVAVLLTEDKRLVGRPY